ncbi:MAG: phage regulatory CII family protein [Desulfovibrio fairfieldensis]|nr:phage regulatory CII family protein [Desulfovibrio fairfieldensis]
MSALTAICHAMVKNAPNGLSAEQVADVLGCPYATMMSELSAQPGHKLGAERMMALMKATEGRAPLHEMARELGGVFVEMPPVSVSGHEVTRGLVACIREFGDFAAQVARSLDDGTVTAEELARICADGQDALTAILKVMELARNAQERGGP